MQGGEDAVAAALGRGDLSAAQLGEAERILLEWVELLTRESFHNSEADVARVRNAGWSEEQIAEAVYITALFAFFNRVADAFGLEQWRWQDPGPR